MNGLDAGSGWRILPCGEAAVLLETTALTKVLVLYQALRESPPEGIADLVPAARTVLITFDPKVTGARRVRQWARERIAATALKHDGPGPHTEEDSANTGGLVRIEVRYDGEDLTEVAEHLGIPRAEVIRMHTSAVWTAAFTGFAPGFAYLVTDQNRLQVPRRKHPRTKVPPGSVGLAGEFSGIYPRASPGGWQLIGSTDAQLWNSAAERPSLISPATRVQFVAVGP